MKRIALVLAAATMLGGCEFIGLGEKEAVDELRDHRRAWLRQNIRAYSYEYELSCFCPVVGAVTITVANDSVQSVVSKTTGQPITRMENDGYRTITALYDYLIDVAEDADEVDANFEASVHIPANVRVDRYKNAVDDEFEMRLRNFQVNAP